MQMLHFPAVLCLVLSLRQIGCEVPPSQDAESDLQNIAGITRAERKCVPMLSRWTPSAAKGAQPSEQSLPQELSFSFGDVDVPLDLQQVANPLHSAMRLFSVLEKQIYGEEDEEDPSDGQTDGAGPQKLINVIQFKQNKLYMSGLNLTMLNVHLYNQSEPRFGLGVQIKNTTLYGQFLYSGQTPSNLISSQTANKPHQRTSPGGQSNLEGIYRMSIDNALIAVQSNLTKTFHRSETRALIKQSGPKLIVNDFQMNISDLGYVSIDILDSNDPRKTTSNYVLRMLQRVLQRTIKRIYYSFEKTLRSTLETEGKRFLDCELTRFEPLLIHENHQRKPKQEGLGQIDSEEQRASNASTSLEDLSRIIGNEMKQMNLSRVDLPDFDYQRQILGTSAFIYFTNGSLTGLDNFRLTDETRVKLQDQHLLINASLGWFQLRPHYNWTLYVGNSFDKEKQNNSRSDASALNDNTKPTNRQPMSSGFVAFNIKTIEFDAVISRGLIPSSRIVVDELTISRLDGLKMEFGGLPGMNRLARGLVNFFMGRLKQRLVGSIQPALKRELELVLNRLPILNNHV